jgi:hypothetical protein
MAAVAGEGVAHAAGFVVLPVITSNVQPELLQHLELRRVHQGGKRTLLLAQR